MWFSATRYWTSGAAATALWLIGTAAHAETLVDDPAYQASLAALAKLFVLAVLLENAFALIFNWRVFQAYFSGRGMRTIVMIVASVLLVYQLKLDIVADLIQAYDSSTPAKGWITGVLTALILAGGSSGVNTVMQALGYREANAAETVVVKPARDKAWIAVRVKRVRAIGEVYVLIRDLGSAAGDSPAPIASTVGNEGPTLRSLLLRDRMRFPQSGGYDLLPNTLYEVTVEGRDAQGQRIAPIDQRKLVLAPGAIVDLLAVL